MTRKYYELIKRTNRRQKWMNNSETKLGTFLDQTKIFELKAEINKPYFGRGKPQTPEKKKPENHTKKPLNKKHHYRSLSQNKRLDSISPRPASTGLQNSLTKNRLKKAKKKRNMSICSVAYSSKAKSNLLKRRRSFKQMSRFNLQQHGSLTKDGFLNIPSQNLYSEFTEEVNTEKVDSNNTGKSMRKLKEYFLSKKQPKIVSYNDKEQSLSKRILGYVEKNFSKEIDPEELKKRSKRRFLF